MNLTDLYVETPVEEHGNIVVAGGRVYVLITDGTEEYCMLPGGELELVRSDRANPLAVIRQGLVEIKDKLGL